MIARGLGREWGGGVGGYKISVIQKNEFKRSLGR